MKKESVFPMPNTSLREATPTTSLRDAVRVRSVQVPNAQCTINEVTAKKY
ncbi:MAG: hypothetical protein HWQ38_10755 [Nostoc sp. NMS7]|nr:hypothetical protein [Nostoc sp. NMS7]